MRMIDSQLPQPEPDETYEAFIARAHRALMDAIPEPRERNEAIWSQWRAARGLTPEEQIALRTFAGDRYRPHPNVCVFAEHSAVTSEGEPREYDGAEMMRAARGANERILDVDCFAPITEGHTSPPDDPREKDPEILGYAGPYRLGMIGRQKPRWAVFCDEWHRPDKLDRLASKPRRSVELWTFKDDPDKIYFDPIAALGAETPRLPLPVQYRHEETRDGAHVERYAAPTLPGASNTFVRGEDYAAEEWDESKYLRDEDGKFTDKAGGTSGARSGSGGSEEAGDSRPERTGGESQEDMIRRVMREWGEEQRLRRILREEQERVAGGSAHAPPPTSYPEPEPDPAPKPWQGESELDPDLEDFDDWDLGDGPDWDSVPTPPGETADELRTRLLEKAELERRQEKETFEGELRTAADLYDAGRAWDREFKQAWREMTPDERRIFRNYTRNAAIKRGIATGAALLAGGLAANKARSLAPVLARTGTELAVEAAPRIRRGAEQVASRASHLPRAARIQAGRGALRAARRAKNPKAAAAIALGGTAGALLGAIYSGLNRSRDTRSPSPGRHSMTTANGNTPTRYGLASAGLRTGRAALRGIGNMAQATGANPKGALGIAAGGYGAGRVHQKARDMFAMSEPAGAPFSSGNAGMKNMPGLIAPSGDSRFGLYAAEEETGSNDRLEQAKAAMRKALGDQYCNDEADSYAADESPSDTRGVLALPVRWSGTEQKQKRQNNNK